MDKESRNSQAGSSALGSHKAAMKVLVRTAVSSDARLGKDTLQAFVAFSSIQFLAGCWTKDRSFDGCWMETTFSSLPNENSKLAFSKPARGSPSSQDRHYVSCTSYCLCRILIVTEQLIGPTTHGHEYQGVGIISHLRICLRNLNLLTEWKAMARREEKSVFR